MEPIREHEQHGLANAMLKPGSRSQFQQRGMQNQSTYKVSCEKIKWKRKPQKKALINKLNALDNKKEIEHLHQDRHRIILWKLYPDFLPNRLKKNDWVESLKEEAKTNALSHINDILDASNDRKTKRLKVVIQNPFNGLQPKQPSKTQLRYFTSILMKWKVALLVAKDEIYGTEAATGGGIIVDDTPEAIAFSLWSGSPRNSTAAASTVPRRTHSPCTT